VVLLHGGPGAPGSLASLAEDLADAFRVLEPFQRGSGGAPLTVARHVADLQDLVTAQPAPPAIVGHSWGAMLALAHAAAHPGSVASLALVGCGTFDPAARRRLEEIRASRMDAALRADLERLARTIADPHERLAAIAQRTLSVDCCDLLAEPSPASCDARAHRETWEDMLRLQTEGVYPKAFAAIRVPVLMLHGADDPHPGALIRASLVRSLPHLQYREWERCGHYPWLERAARDGFLAVLRGWLARGAAAASPASRGSA
jgi:pimeloyl-ACP methyl ester carboxylesterase